MSVELWLAFVAASAVLLIIPGPTILMVISYSMAHGRRANVPLVAAVALGDSTALAVSLLGLGALLATSAFWFTVVKGVGGLYLLYLGIKMLRAGVSPHEVSAPTAPGSRWKLFANTYIVTALNPKGIVFFVAFLPQFISQKKRWRYAATLGSCHYLRRYGNAQCNPVRHIRWFSAKGTRFATSTAVLQSRWRLSAFSRRCVGTVGQAPHMKTIESRWLPWGLRPSVAASHIVRLSAITQMEFS